MTRLVTLCALPWLLALAACGDNLAGPTAGDDDPGEIDDGIATPGLGLAVVNSDYTTTVISLLSRVTGEVRNGRCLDSSSTAPGVSLALSGDVVLPSAPQPGNLLLTIDRGNAALTWTDPVACRPLRQLDVKTGFASNPYDVVGLSETKAYVLRYARNPTPTPAADDFDDGDDILIIDPSKPAITGRIDLADHTAAGVLASPTSARLIDGKVYVVLTHQSADAMVGATGRVLVIDPATDAVTDAIDLPGLQNCADLSYVAATRTLAVNCIGNFYAADQTAVSGVAFLDLAQSPPVVTHTQAAAVFGGSPVAAYTSAADDGAVGYAVTFGGAGPDQLWQLDVAAGTATSIGMGTAQAFTFGTLLLDTGHRRLYLTDGASATPRVHLYGVAGGAPVLEASVNPDPSVGLPPRELAWY